MILQPTSVGRQVIEEVRRIEEKCITDEYLPGNRQQEDQRDMVAAETTKQEEEADRTNRQMNFEEKEFLEMDQNLWDLKENIKEDPIIITTPPGQQVNTPDRVGNQSLFVSLFGNLARFDDQCGSRKLATEPRWISADNGGQKDKPDVDEPDEDRSDKEEMDMEVRDTVRLDLDGNCHGRTGNKEVRLDEMSKSNKLKCKVRQEEVLYRNKEETDQIIKHE